MTNEQKDALELLKLAKQVADEFSSANVSYVFKTPDLVALAQIIQCEQVRQSKARQTIGPDGRWTRAKE